MVDETPLYIRWRTSFTSKGKVGAYGIKSNTTQTEERTNIKSEKGHVELKVDNGMSLKLDNYYYLKINNKLQRFQSPESLAKLFKNNENDIKLYVKDEKIDFKKLDDIKKVVAYCSQYIK